jgi:hypothetical protein
MMLSAPARPPTRELLACGLLLQACTGGCVGEDGTASVDAAVLHDRDAAQPADGSLAESDAYTARDASGPVQDSAAPVPARCGDVEADTSRPPLEAIKRLATTQEEVRILVYGQSISEGTWWLDVRDWLLEQYPNGNLVMEEHARGGCAAQCLIGREPWFLDGQTENRVPEDVFAWEPDLILFHVFGRHDDYESLVRGFATGCAGFADHPVATARCQGSQLFPEYEPPEILLQTYHRLDDLDHTAVLPMLPPIPEGEWDYWMSTSWIPGVSERHGAQVVDIWNPWGDYLREHELGAADLLVDDEHPNEAGNQLLAALTKPALCYAPP